MSGAGKSLLATALCRIFRQDGLRVAPFKSQNMALNSYITRDGLEMGRAQVAQAEAAGREPDVRMNPVLLKPSSDTGSQLIVNGEVRGQYRAAEYFKMKKSLVPEILRAYESLAAENDVIVIEGAGSPAEINLRDGDIVNMGLAELVNAPVLLVGDIDRGGVFAQLYGTVALLQPKERARVVGTVINKFRGDVELLRPGLAMLEEKTGVPVLSCLIPARTSTTRTALRRALRRRSSGVRWTSRWCACRASPILRIFPRWRATPRWACGMWSGPGSWASRTWWCCRAQKTRWETLPGCARTDWRPR